MTSSGAADARSKRLALQVTAIHRLQYSKYVALKVIEVQLRSLVSLFQRKNNMLHRSIDLVRLWGYILCLPNNIDFLV